MYHSRKDTAGDDIGAESKKKNRSVSDEEWSTGISGGRHRTVMP